MKELIEGINARYCKKCGELKSFEEFSTMKKGKYGLSSRCKICDKKYREENKEYYKKYREENKEYYKKYREENKEYYKKYREENKDYISEINKKYREENKDYILEKNKKYREENKDYILEKNKKYYQENKEYYKKYREENKDYISEINKKWREENKDYILEYNRKSRALKRNAIGNFTESQFKETLEYFNWECAYSGESILDDLSNCHREHIVPLSKGGDNGIWNIVPSLDSVNLSKNDSDMEKWYRQQPYFSEERLKKIYEYMNLMEEIYLDEYVS